MNYNHFQIKGKTIRLAGNTVALKSAINKIRFEQERNYIAEYVTIEIKLDEHGERIRYFRDEEVAETRIETYRVEEEKGEIIFRLTKVNDKDHYSRQSVTSDEDWELHYDLKNLAEAGKITVAYSFTFNVFFGDVGFQEIKVTGKETPKTDLNDIIEKTVEEIYEDIDTFFGVNEEPTKCYIKD